MKLKVIFIKRKYLYIGLAILIALLLAIILFKIFNNKLEPTFNVISNQELYKIDLNGNGKNDILYIKNCDGKYLLQVNTDDGKSNILEPSDKIKTVGTYSEHWPLRVTIKDANRDDKPEIFVQSSDNDKPIQHIFLYDYGRFKDIYCSNNNILGFVDYSNDKTPKIITGNYKDNKISFFHNILIKNTLKSYKYNYDEGYMGKDTISYFISNMNNLDDFSKNNFELLKNVTVSDINEDTYKILMELSDKTSKLEFQDAFFKDIMYDKDNRVSQVEWNLNFKCINKKDKNVINYNLILQLQPESTSKDKYYYKINNIKIKK